MQSELGVGSTFTLFLPREYVPPQRRAGRAARRRVACCAGAERRISEPSATAPSATLAGARTALSDDRHGIQPGDRVLLIVEDDATFGRILLDLAREHGFRGVVASTAQQGLELARTLQPRRHHARPAPARHGRLGGARSAQARPETRHIPVHVISASDERAARPRVAARSRSCRSRSSRRRSSGAGRASSSFLERRVKQLLVVEDDEVQRKSIVELIGDGDVVTTAVDSGEEALAALESERFDCMVLDLQLPGMSGFELIEARQGDRRPRAACRSSSTRARS